MTDNFYIDLLTYITPKVKQHLCLTLQKHGVRIKGFRLNGDIPTKILANNLAKNELGFHKLLKDTYKPDFLDKDDAVRAFSPDNAIMCLTYFLNIGVDDEEFLSNLINPSMTRISTQEEVQVPKGKKRSDEFRNKYMAAHKQVVQLEEQLVEAHKLIDQQKCTIDDYEKELLSIKEEFLQLKTQHDTACENYINKISELESIVAEQVAQKEETENKVVVIQKNVLDLGKSVCVVCYDQISTLPEIAHQYFEILFVANEIPFPVKRQISKMREIQDKFHAFTTNSELQEYIEKRSTN